MGERSAVLFAPELLYSVRPKLVKKLFKVSAISLCLKDYFFVLQSSAPVVFIVA